MPDVKEKRLIDADALKEIALKRGYSVRIDKYTGRWPCLLVADIRNVPTVDAAEVVHGRWINWGKSGTPTYENYGTCSVCHEDAEICTEHRNYCPNCGAKMDGDVEHDNS